MDQLTLYRWKNPKADSINISLELGSITKMVPILRDTTNVTKNYSPVVSADGRSLTVHIGDLAPEQRNDDSLWCLFGQGQPSILLQKQCEMTATSKNQKIKVADNLYQFLDGDFNGRKYSFTILKKEWKWPGSCRCCFCCDSRWSITGDRN